jgi:hypothetical protein
LWKPSSLGHFDVGEFLPDGDWKLVILYGFLDQK